MSDPRDIEWGELGERWRGGPAKALQARVTRAGRVQALRVVIETAVALLGALVLVHMAQVHGTRAAERWAALGLLNLLLYWAFLQLNRIGTWRLLAATTRGFLDLAERRAIRQARGASAVLVVLAAELILLTAWLTQEGLLFDAGGVEGWKIRGVVVGVALAAGGAAILRGRAAAAELRALGALQAELMERGDEL